MKIQKTLFFLIVLLFSVGSVIAQTTISPAPGEPGGPPVLPGSGDGGNNANDVPAPIDGQIWVGLIGGLAIGGYFLMKKRAIKID
jgi:hypothetical protein